MKHASVWVLFIFLAINSSGADQLYESLECSEFAVSTDYNGPPIWKMDPIEMPSACVDSVYVLDLDFVFAQFDCHCDHCPCGCSTGIASKGWLHVDNPTATLKGTPATEDIGILKVSVAGRNDYGTTGAIVEIGVVRCSR